MKNWVIVEDRPWVMEGLIMELKEKAEKYGVLFVEPKILYFIPGDFEEERNARKEKYSRIINMFCQNTRIEPISVTKDTFEAEMDKYVDERYVILMDLNLNGSESIYFHSRQNVQYVKRKLGEDTHKQIWFYTTGASLDSRFLIEEFPDNCISVEGFADGKVMMDTDVIWSYLKND